MSSMTWRDSTGRALCDYPRPSIAVDVALLTLDDKGRLAVLLHERVEDYGSGQLALPGTFVREQELLREAALRALRDKVGVTGEEPEQLRVFDDLQRDDRGRVMSVAHVDLVPPGCLGAGCSLVAISGFPPRALLPDGRGTLAFDHDKIVAAAVEWARDLYRAKPDPSHLIADEFTLFDLQRVHEAVAGRALAKDAFRRGMLPLLEETGEVRRGVVGKPARVFRRRRISTGKGQMERSRLTRRVQCD